MLDRFLFDLLRWTLELNPGSAPARQERGTPETDNSMRGHKEAQNAQGIIEKRKQTHHLRFLCFFVAKTPLA